MKTIDFVIKLLILNLYIFFFFLYQIEQLKSMIKNPIEVKPVK